MGRPYIPAVVTDCLTCGLPSLFFTYDRAESIMAVIVFYGYWGRTRCKVFAFSTYRKQVMAVFVLPFRSKTAPV